MVSFSRRWVLSALAATAASPAFANAPARSLVPPPRPAAASGAARVAAAPSAEALIRAAQLGGQVSYLVADAGTGAVLEDRSGGSALPPASVIKALTTLYALDVLGASHRFRTLLMANGPVQGGRIEGDLLLVGGGDPVLSTDGLAEMAAQLKDRGVREVRGRFLVYGTALPRIPQIDPDQPDHVGYNPAISAMNLNFNRVNFQWQRSGNAWEVAMNAPDQRFNPRVGIARMQVVSRQTPVYTYSRSGNVDQWTVASAALGNGGSRWLPVRAPELYAGDVLRSVARSYGLQLPEPQLGSGQVQGTILVDRQSAPLRGILADMMRFSTNLTAEVVGLSASVVRGARPGTLAESGQAMADWAAARMGVTGLTCADHSGLGDRSRISPAAMVALLTAARPDGPLRGLMRDFPLRDARGNILHDHPVRVDAKTGTLNFVSGLAGYISRPSGPDLAFAVFAADMATRNRVPPDQRERPVGGRDWAGRARRLQQGLIERWIAVHS